MPLTLIELTEYPDRLAVTKIDKVIHGGAFFLDFTRPLEVLRWLGIRNRWVGFAVGLLVPVVHQGEEHGGFVISVNPTDPYFSDIRALWKKQYPSKGFALTAPPADGLSIIGAFAAQFPIDAQPQGGGLIE